MFICFWFVLFASCFQGLKSCDEVPEDKRDLIVKFQDNSLKRQSKAEEVRAYLAVIPAIISNLGLLILLTDKDKDFELKEPVNGFEHINHKTFTPTIVQLSHAITGSFIKAHGNLKIVKTRMDYIPGIVKKLNCYVRSGKPSFIRKFVPYELASMKEHAEIGLKFASETADAFAGTQNLIEEIIGVLSATQKVYSDQLTNITQRVDAKVNEVRARQSQLNSSEAAIKMEEAKLENLEKSFKTAYDNIPGSWSVVGMEAVKALGNLMTSGTRMISGTLESIKQVSGGAEISPQVQAKLEKANVGQSNFLAGIYLSAARVLSIYVVETKKKANGYASNGMKEKFSRPNITGMLNSFLIQLPDTSQCKKEIKTQIGQYESSVKKLAQLIRKRGSPEEFSKVIAEFQGLENELAPLVTAEAQNRGAPNGPSELPTIKPPGGKDVPQEKPGQSEIKTAKMQLDNLKAAEDRQTKKKKENRNKIIQLARMQADLIRLNAKQLDLKAYLEVIGKAVKFITEMKENWSKLSNFFREIVSAVGTQMSMSIEEYQSAIQSLEKDAERIGSNSTTNKKQKKALLDAQVEELNGEIQVQTTEITGQCGFVVLLCNYYVAISEKLIMPRLNGLDKLSVVPDVHKKKMKDILRRYNNKATALIWRFANRLGAKEKKKRLKRIVELEQIAIEACNATALEEQLNAGKNASNAVNAKFKAEDQLALDSMIG